MQSVFDEITKSLKDLSRRINKFETWEPAAGMIDTGAMAYRNNNQAIGAGVWTTITFNAELWDTDNIHAGGTMTIPVDGKYLLTTTLYTSGFAGNFSVMFNKSASEQPIHGYGGTVISGHFSVIMDCLAGDAIVVQANPSVGTTILGSAAFPWTSFFEIQRIG